MEDTHSESDLLLPDLFVDNFRGIRKLSISRLGRVTLLAGRNGAGKTSVLDAVRIFSARGRFNVLGVLLNNREERVFLVDDNYEEVAEPDWTALFYGRNITEDVQISIGPKKDAEHLTISVTLLTDKQPFLVERLAPYRMLEGRIRALTVRYKELGYSIPLQIPNDMWEHSDASDSKLVAALRGPVGFGERTRDQELPPPLKCYSVGPGMLDNFALSAYWTKVALTDGERLVAESLKMMYGEEVERVSVVGAKSASSKVDGRQAIAKLRNRDRPVPLISLGDGAMRLFGITLALANCRDGFLLIDEVENGIHYSVQQDFWRMMLRTARENNVQVFATTHSWDCVRGFAQAAVENENVEGVLVRLEKEEDGLRAVRYSERKLRIAAEQGIEVR